MKFFVLDTRDVWHSAIIKSAKARGYDAKRIFRGEEVGAPGSGFIRCHADPVELRKNQRDWDLMSARLTMIQDEAQVRVYENKSEQFRRWSRWMPDTWRFETKDEALEFVEDASFPLVSKADIGASSVNVRVMPNKGSAIAHVEQLFGSGVMALHCAGSAKSLQKGYALFQRFIPHKITWRVNAIGSKRAAFMRYCYPDRPVAQTGNVEPVMQMTEQVESLFEFSNRFLAEIKTNWCAIDVLQDGDEWKILETSMSWPWPSPGVCNQAPIFGSGKTWLQMFDVMMDELESGVFSSPSDLTSTCA